MLGLPATSQHSPAFLIALGFAAILVIYVALKIGADVLKFIFGLIGLALLAAGVWWFFFRH